MGLDSIDMQRSQYVMHSLLFFMRETCACDVYNREHKCMRCDMLQRGCDAYPIQYAQAQASFERAYGVQP